MDHLVIGPGGIVVVDSYAWVGRIEVSRGVVQQNGFWREPECAEVARMAGSVAALLLPQHRTAVHAVICVAQHELAEHLVDPGVHVVGVSGLARLLRSLPRRLHPAEVLQLQTRLAQALAEAAPPEQLTTANFDFLSGGQGLGDSGAASGSGCLFGPAAGRPPRSAARTAARRRRQPLPRRGPGWRALGVRLLLVALVAVGAFVLAPDLLHRSVDAAPRWPAGTPASQSSSSGSVAVSDDTRVDGLTRIDRFAEAQDSGRDVAPPAVTAPETVTALETGVVVRYG
jgi:hypothetical protein